MTRRAGTRAPLVYQVQRLARLLLQIVVSALSITMADAAVTQLLNSAAPGQFDDIVAQIGRLGITPSNLDVLKHDHQLAQGQGIGANNASISNPLAAELKEKLQNYHQRAFSGAGGRGIATKKVNVRVWLLAGESSSQFQICSFAEKLDLQNMQTAIWKSTWTINGNDTQADLQGKIEIHTYSYEDGNTQVKTSQSFGVETIQSKPGSGEEGSLSHGIVSKIAEWERHVLGILKGVHELTADSLKQIRRVLPITKTKMNWEVEAQRGVAFLKQTATKR